MKNNSAFTLVELIVWVTISMLLMVSVWLILSSWIQNILKQEKVISSNENFSAGFQNIYKNFDSVEDNYIFSSNSGTLFQSKNYFQKIWFAYFWIIEQSDSYCPIDWEIEKTQHLSWNYFLPFEEIWEDFLTNFSQIQNVTVWNFTIDTTNHQILENGTKVIWWNNFGHEFSQGSDGLNVSLNNPTGAVEAEWGLFFSDTGNHRILFYKDSKVYLILDRFDGLDQPTWLAYENGKLFISNSGKWEILQFSSEVFTQNPPLEINFSPDQDYGSINRFELSFTGSEFISDNSFTEEDFSFDEINFTQNEDFLKTENNILKYYFSDFGSENVNINNGAIALCSDNIQYNVTNNNVVEKIETSCTSSGTGSRYTYTWNNSYNLSQVNEYEINLENISPNISQAGNYLSQIDFYDNNDFRYSKIFPYFTQWTGKISDYSQNSLEVFVENLQYPTGLEISGNILTVNDSLERKQYEYELVSWVLSDTNNMSDFTTEWLKNIIFNPLSDEIIQNPISNISVNYENNYLWMNIEYFHYLNCYNPDEFIKKEIIFWKNLEN